MIHSKQGFIYIFMYIEFSLGISTVEFITLRSSVIVLMKIFSLDSRFSRKEKFAVFES